MVRTTADRRVLRRVEHAVLWGSFPVLVACFVWLMGTSRPLVPATAFVLVFGLSMGVQVSRAVRRDGVEREIMLRSAAISYPIVVTVLVMTVIAALVGVVDAGTALGVPLIVALVAQSMVEGVLTQRLG